MSAGSHVRCLLKAVSWRIFGTLTTMGISYLFTGKMSTALYIGLSEFLLKIGIFYVHERVWGAISLGQAKSTQILINSAEGN